MSESIKKQINQIAHAELSHLNKESPQYEIMESLENFANTLINKELIEGRKTSRITRSQKMPVELKHYYSLKYVSRLVGEYFNTVDCFCINSTTGDGIIFIGAKHNIYAIAMTVYEEGLKKFKHCKIQKNKESKADHYRENWLDNLLGWDREHARYTISGGATCIQYVKRNFRNLKYQRKIMLQAHEIIKPFYDNSVPDSMTWGDFKKQHYKKFPKTLINKIIDELDTLQSEDIVMFFPYEEWGLKQQNEVNDD